MRLTVTDSDNKRLLKALVLACGLYGSLMGLVLAVPVPAGAPMAERVYASVRVSLLPAVRPESPRARHEASVPESAQSPPATVEAAPLRPEAQPLQDAQPAAADLARTPAPPETDFPPDFVRTEPALPGLTPGTIAFRAAAAAGVDAGPAGGTDTTGDWNSAGAATATGQGGPAAAKARFLAWLDSAIRGKLVYPERARRRKIEGTVSVRLTVSADGSRCDASVAAGSGSALLDRAAVELVRSLFPSAVSPGKEFTDSIEIEYLLVQD